VRTGHNKTLSLEAAPCKGLDESAQQLTHCLWKHYAPVKVTTQHEKAAA